MPSCSPSPCRCSWAPCSATSPTRSFHVQWANFSVLAHRRRAVRRRLRRALGADRPRSAAPRRGEGARPSTLSCCWPCGCSASSMRSSTQGRLRHHAGGALPVGGRGGSSRSSRPGWAIPVFSRERWHDARNFLIGRRGTRPRRLRRRSRPGAARRQPDPASAAARPAAGHDDPPARPPGATSARRCRRATGSPAIATDCGSRARRWCCPMATSWWRRAPAATRPRSAPRTSSPASSRAWARPRCPAATG